MNLGSIITVPFNWLLMSLYNLVSNYGVAIILFALVVKIILLPFQMKSKRSTMRMASLNPQLKALEKKYGDNKQKYQEEVQKLYKEENIKPLGGCLWSLIPFPILIALYSVIRMPLKHAMGMSETTITAVTEKLVSLGVYTIPEKANAYSQITLANLIHENFDAIKAAFPGEKVLDINYKFLGMNLGQTPNFRFWTYDWSDPKVWLPAVGLLLIPIISAVLSWLQTKVSSSQQPASGTDQQAAQMKSMTLMMPLISLYIGFVMPAALGVYWIAQYVFGILQEIILNKHYGKIIAAEEAERNERFRLREEELERKRQETERLRAEGKTQQNANTSKKKLQAQERDKEDRRKAAEAREELRKKRVAMGLPADPEIPESQVGNRRYARGRAYVADRFTNPETAEERTRLAAEASEGESPIDESIPDDIALPAPDAAEAPETEAVQADDVQADDAADADDEEPWDADSDEDPWDNEDDEDDKSDGNGTGV